MVVGLWWSESNADHIRRRSERYGGGRDLEPEWTLEAVADPERIERAPDPNSAWGYTRIIGYSPSAGAVLTVIVRPRDHAGMTAWPTRGADLRAYRQGREGSST